LVGVVTVTLGSSTVAVALGATFVEDKKAAQHEEPNDDRHDADVSTRATPPALLSMIVPRSATCSPAQRLSRSNDAGNRAGFLSDIELTAYVNTRKSSDKMSSRT